MIDWEGMAVKHGFNAPKELLEHLYWDKKLSTLEIADKLIVSNTSVWTALVKYGIPTRSRAKIRSGPGCPKCSIGNSKVSHSVRTKAGVIRHRICNSCGTKFKTKEVVINDETELSGTDS